MAAKRQTPLAGRRPGRFRDEPPGLAEDSSALGGRLPLLCMSEQSEPHPADEILGADWHPPERDLRARLWEDHPERERIEKLWQEKDEKGQRLWNQWTQDDPEDSDWTELWLGPVDRFDLSRPSEMIGRWHRKQDADKIAEAQAIVEEHDDD